jgi:hypothetical protein
MIVSREFLAFETGEKAKYPLDHFIGQPVGYPSKNTIENELKNNR